MPARRASPWWPRLRVHVRRRATTLAALAGLLLLSLALRAPRIDLAARLESARIVPSLLRAMVVAGGLTALLAVALGAPRPQGPRVRRPSGRRIASALAVGMLLALIVQLAGWDRLQDASPGTGPGGVAAPVPVAPGLAVSISTLVAGLAVALALAGVARALRRPPVSVTPRPEPAAVASAAAQARSDLESHADPRAGVIAAFATLCTLLAARGTAPASSDTPGEIVRRALVEAGAPVEPTTRLLEVYERARFSRLEVREADRLAAVAALADVEGALAPTPPR